MPSRPLDGLRCHPGSLTLFSSYLLQCLRLVWQTKHTEPCWRSGYFLYARKEEEDVKLLLNIVWSSSVQHFVVFLYADVDFLVCLIAPLETQTGRKVYSALPWYSNLNTFWDTAWLLTSRKKWMCFCLGFEIWWVFVGSRFRFGFVVVVVYLFGFCRWAKRSQWEVLG